MRILIQGFSNITSLTWSQVQGITVLHFIQRTRRPRLQALCHHVLALWCKLYKEHITASTNFINTNVCKMANFSQQIHIHGKKRVLEGSNITTYKTNSSLSGERNLNVVLQWFSCSGSQDDSSWYFFRF
jgi:hypothetical protein